MNDNFRGRNCRKTVQPQKTANVKTGKEKNLTTPWDDDPEEEIPIHSLADLFPPMDQEEYEGLKASIENHGFNPAFPVLILDGAIADGRYRYQIARELGIAKEDIPYRTLDGTEDEVLSRSVPPPVPAQPDPQPAGHHRRRAAQHDQRPTQ